MKEWLTGRNPVYEMVLARRRQIFRVLLASGIEVDERVRTVLAAAKTYRVPVETVPRPQVDSLGSHAQGIAAEVSAYPYSDLEGILGLAESRSEPPFLLILDSLQDPQNFGTLIRSAEAFGVHGILIPLRHSAGVTPAVVQASAGAAEHMRIAASNLAQAIERLKKAGCWVVGLEGSPDASSPGALNLRGPIALVVGGEGEGMRNLVRQSCDMLMRLPLEGQISSLNAAVAGSIGLYLIHQARQPA